MTEKEVITLEKYVDTRIDAIEKAVAIAYQAMDKRLDGMNEFRDTIKDLNKSYITRNEHDIVCQDIQSLKESRAEIAGKASQNSVNTAQIISVVSALLALISVVLHFIR